MATTLTREPRPSTIRTGFPPPFKTVGVVYAITFDMDIDQLRAHYGDPYNGAYQEIRKVLEGHGFTGQQASVYFGNAAVTSATVSLAVVDLTTRLPWFAACVRDIRVLRIEEQNDLMPLVHRVAGLAAGGGT